MQHVYIVIPGEKQKPHTLRAPYVLVSELTVEELSKLHNESWFIIEVHGDQDVLGSLTFSIDGDEDMELERRYD